ncbi:MAG: FAD-dependent oxidoreductase [Actinobacteria bacterium]|nr:FAD-dependent oxidoreductase [Actinomycetota bacterium]
MADVVLVGGGLASAAAAEAIRQDGFDGRVTLVTDEPHHPYERPPLSKAVLMGDAPPDTAYVHAPDFYADHDIDVVTGDPVTGIDRHAGTVTTASGTERRFDRLLLATGARPRTLPLGAGLDGVVTLRTLDDSVDLGRRLGETRHVTIVGAGWIGCEVAAAARHLGAAVTVVDPLATPLQRVLGPRIGAVFADLHRANGVELRLGVGVTDLRGDDAVRQVVTSDGSTIDTELVVVGIGVVPNTELAERAGLGVDDGVLVDETLVTADPRIFAAGDVASAWHPRYGRRLRVEHWANARHQGAAAGRNLLGAGEVHDRLPYFYSDQYDVGLEYVGLAGTDDDVVVRGDLAAREFIAFWLADGCVTAAMNLNVWDVVEDLEAIVGSGRRVDRSRLADPELPLAEVRS